MQPYTHLIPFQDRSILYLNGSMKCVLLTPEEQSSFCTGDLVSCPKLFELLFENKRKYHQYKGLKLGPIGLTLNVANTCNLRCSYCYANGGNYHAQDMQMSPDIAVSAVSKFAAHFGALKRIKFFGGEPFLNLEAIRAACETCVRLTEKGVLKQLPNFTTVTNGTIMTQELINLINLYDIGVTVSYDGSPVMQDTLRPYISGCGSSETVLENMKHLQMATDHKQPSSVEVTYTQLHVQKGVSVEQCYDTVRRLLGLDDIKITPVSCVAADIHHLQQIDSFHAAITMGYRKSPINRRIVEKAYRLYQVIISRKRSDRIFCGAGIDRFSVSADGNIYPCYLFTNDEAFCMGNVMEDSFSLLDYESVRSSLMQYNRLLYNECRDCWGSSFCFGCRGNNRRLTGDADIPSPDFCRMLKEIAENLLCCMAEVGDIRTLKDVDLG